MNRKTADRRKGLFLFLFLIIAALAFPVSAAAQSAPSIEGVEFHPSASLIQALVVISSKDNIRYSLVSGSDEGIKTLQIYSGEKLVARKECYGAKNCRLAGVSIAAALQSDILTVEAIASNQKEQKEKIKMNLDQGGEKVYMITALPEMVGQSVELIASATGTMTSSSSNTPPIATGTISLPPDTGPVITLQVLKKEKNTYNLLIVSADPYGVDFVEILQNGRFYDVQECSNARQCKLEKTVIVKSPEKAAFSVKSMNANAKISYQDVPLGYED